MSNHPAISIIIPAYKVEAWVRQAVSSLQGQTFDDWELLLVDDGSPDNTGAICGELAADDSRIRVIYQKNCGAAGARNNAIALARGKYLYFMDADDWCEPSMLEDMYVFAEANDLQLVVTGFYIDTYYADDKFYRECRNAPDIVYASQRDFRENAAALFDAQLLYAPWNKLYLRNYLSENKILFPATFWDDLPFNLDVVRGIERVGCLDGHYYHFLRARAESENTRYRADMYEKREDEHVWMTDLFSNWGVDALQVREFLARRYTERLLGCVENVTNRSCLLNKREKKAEIRRMICAPQARAALAEARPRTFMMRVVLLPMKWGNVTLTKMEGSFISWVKRRSTNVFARLKANR